MDIDEPAEATATREEVRAWLGSVVPEGWTDPGAPLSGDDRRAFLTAWPGLLRDGGWVCASWPVEYGGRGLSPLV